MMRIDLPEGDTERPIIWRSGRSITRGRFLADAARLANALPPGRHILNLCHNRQAFMLGFVAACRRGCINLLPPSEAPAFLTRLALSYKTPLKLDDDRVAELLARDSEPAAATHDEYPVAIAFTSGSTGEPQAHPKPWHQLAETAAISGQVLFGSVFTHVLATVPSQHMYGLEFSVMLALVGRAAIHTGRPFFPRDIAEALAEIPAPRVLLSTPLHLRALALSGIQLPELYRVVSATAPLDRELAQTLERRLSCPVIEIYGCTEAGSLASRRTIEGPYWRPHPGVRIEVQEGKALAFASYLPQPQGLQDFVTIRDDGDFELLGRQSDLLKVAGKRASLQELTHHLLDIPGVQDGVIFMPCAGDAVRLAGLVVAPRLSVAEILDALIQRVDPVFLPRPLRKVEHLPRDAVGKLPRTALLDLLEASDD